MQSVTYLQNVHNAPETYHIVHEGVHGEDGKVGAGSSSDPSLAVIAGSKLASVFYQ